MTSILEAVRPASAGAQALLDAPRAWGLLIDGAWVEGRSGATLPSIDPATGAVIGHIVDASAATTSAAVASARA